MIIKKEYELVQVVSEARKQTDFIWDIAELLRGDYKQADYGIALQIVLCLQWSKWNINSYKENLIRK